MSAATPEGSEPLAPVLHQTTNPMFVRHDAWERLGRLAERLATASRADEDVHTLQREVSELLDLLRHEERFFAYPGPARMGELGRCLAQREYATLVAQVRVLGWRLGRFGDAAAVLDDAGARDEDTWRGPRYFTLLVVSDTDEAVLAEGLDALLGYQRPDDDLVYHVVAVASFEEALTAALVNPDVQAVLMRYDFPFYAEPRLRFYADTVEMLDASSGLSRSDAPPRSFALGQALRRIRPHLDLYLLTDEHLPDAHDPTADVFTRVFDRFEARSELHMTVLAGVRARVATPFFDALKAYADRPIGNFHALPIARGNSLFNSRWVRDMVDFYGRNIFLAETSATSGGLDSLLAPHGTLKQAQDKAARTWGAQRTFFSTNGTSTANKIVVQALTRPGDVVLIDRNCHKSHHYGLVLGGAHPVYLDAYPVPAYVTYGSVPLRTIKQRLLELRRAGRLDAARMLLLTNCTFDGIVADPRRVMAEALAIAPHLVFLWDEAWFAFANVHPVIRRRTAMMAAADLQQMLASASYAEQYARHQAVWGALDPDDDATWLDHRLLAPPGTHVRAYATQSTHKSLSSLRQGSMIHVFDDDFERRVAPMFAEAFNTHTSTSPNYQILASLDLARRQVELEGYGMVAHSYEIAIAVRRRIAQDTLLQSCIRVLETADLVPAEHRGVSADSYRSSGPDEHSPWQWVRVAADHDEFLLDPTRITLDVSGTGLNGDEFKNVELMDRYGIQVNKTSINTVLLIVTIGATWGSVDYLLDVLRQIARRHQRRRQTAGEAAERAFQRRVERLRTGLPSLPDFSAFHPAYRPHDGSPEGDMRAAFFAGYHLEDVEFVLLDEAIERVAAGEALVSATFVVPYPPGFPVLVPGQLMSREILAFLAGLDVKEIHGYEPDLGLAVLTSSALTPA